MISTRICKSRLALSITLVLAASGLRAATLTVDSMDDSSLSMACNLRSALTAIDDGSTMSVPACSSAVSGGPFGSNDTILFAAGLEYSSTVLYQGVLEIAASSVTISGSGQAINAAGYSSVFVVGANAALYASNLYFVNGQAASNGGAVSVGENASASFTNCRFMGNSTTADGGAIYAAPSSTLKLVQSTLSWNSGRAGGAIFASYANVRVENTSIYRNTAALLGGGIDAAYGLLELDTAMINSNTAHYEGAGWPFLVGR
jgi:predicted outer membrane repeat protein